MTSVLPLKKKNQTDLILFCLKLYAGALSISEHSSGCRLIHVQLWYTKCHPFLLLHLCGHECSTVPQLLQSSCAAYLCHSHWGARQRGELGLLCSFCPVIIYALQADCLRAHPERRGYIRSKGQDGILWTCQYVVNIETASTSRAGMACPAHVHCVKVPTVQWGLRLLYLHSPHKESFESMLEMQAVHRQTASLHFPSVKTEIMLTSLLIWRLVVVVL